MKKRIIAVLVFCANSLLAATNGIPNVTVDGTEWKDIERVSVGIDGRIIIIVPGGGTTTTEDKLPPEFLGSWGITEETLHGAKETRKDKAQNDFERAIRSGQFRVVDGVVYDLRKQQASWTSLVNIRVLQVLDDGVIAMTDERSDNPVAVFIKNLPQTVSDTDKITVTALLTGNYSYINKAGSDRTIKAYDVGRPCSRSEIPDAIVKDGKLFARLSVGAIDKRTTGISKNLPETDSLKASGSGFFITKDGYVVTNAHVVKGAQTVKVRTKQGIQIADIVEVDAENDLALLKITGNYKPIPISTSTASLGEPVFTIGFPNIELQGLEPKYTDGKISSLSGMHDDPVTYQVSVPVQPGNSGGPLVDAKGNIVGVIVAKLNDVVTLRTSGSVPQNVNYAVKAKYLRTLLSKHPEVSLGTIESAPNQEGAVKAAEQSVVMILIY